MSDKSPRHGKSAGSAKSIKQKRAEKRAAHKVSPVEDVVSKIAKHR